MFARVSRFLSSQSFIQRSASSLVIAEHSNSNLNLSTLSTITAATKLSGDISGLIIGHYCESVAQQAAKIPRVSKVLYVDNEIYTKPVAEDISRAAAHIIRNGSYSHIFAPSSNFGKNYIPRLAAELDIAPLTDVIEIVNEETFVRPMYAGNAICTFKASDPTKILTVRTTAFEKSQTDGGSASVEQASAPDQPSTGLSRFVSETVSRSERPELTSARVVVSGGRGMKNGENFKLLEQLADKLGGAVGASRAAVDAGFVPNELQVGQTGKVVAPELYVAVGISGAIQHLSGMKDSKVIVAINKDPEAPIFQVADYGLVDDLFKVVPEMTEKL